jgi:glycerol-3-phosphate acyltransferase PlsY
VNLEILAWAGFAMGAYLLGAVPFAFLIGRLRGVDIRKVGSGNVGATNVFRTVGKPWGIAAFVLDAAKGFVPAFLFPKAMAAMTGAEAHREVWALVFMALAIAGHNWPVYLGFRGGKGVATSAGGLLGAAPAAVGVGAAAWVAVFGLGRYVSLASIVTAIVVAASAWIFYGAQEVVRPVAITVLAAVIILRHRSNIQRLRAGTEHRFTFGRGAKVAKGAP